MFKFKRIIVIIVLCYLISIYFFTTRFSKTYRFSKKVYSLISSRSQRALIRRGSYIHILKDLLNCKNENKRNAKQQRGQYLVYSNYIKRKLKFKCYETVTYATHGEFTFLENLLEITDRWKGPISVSIHCSGDDYNNTMKTILYLKQCYKGIDKFVSFHLIFHEEHFPSLIFPPEVLRNIFHVNCSGAPPWKNVTSYRNQHGLIYPVNVLRNAAKYSTDTFFHLMSDIELYPSENIIDRFLTMIAENPNMLRSENPKVFVLPIFEVNKTEEAPKTKKKLIELIKGNRGNRFHQYTCVHCQLFPNFTNWLEAEEKETMSVLIKTKREGDLKNAEPLFIGTQMEPEYDERLSWEGKHDKMVQVISKKSNCIFGKRFSFKIRILSRI